MELVAKEKLTESLKAMARFNGDIPEWVYGIIKRMRPVQCEDCKWWKNYYCGLTGQIRGKNSVCEEWRNE